jgi:hypothetical protein
MAMRPPIRLVVYGHTGAWKTSLLKTFPKPLLVWSFDGHGKDFPFFRDSWHRLLPESAIGKLQQYQVPGTDVLITYRDVQHPDGLVRIEYYHDPVPEKPHAFADWRIRRSVFHHELDIWKTVGLDSFTSAETAARLNEKYWLNPQTDKEYKSRDPRKWWGGSTDAMEEALKVSFLSYPMNVVVIAHVDQERDESAVAGTTLRNPMAPGRLRGGLAQQYMELYYAYVHSDPKTGRRMGLLQTVSNGIYNAASQINAPDPCYAHYESLWENYDKEQEVQG